MKYKSKGPHLLLGVRDSREQRGAWMVLVIAVLALAVLWTAIVAVLSFSRQSTIEAEQRVLERMSLVVEEQTRHLFSLVALSLVNVDRMISLHPHDDPRTSPEFLSLADAVRVRSKDNISIRLIAEDGTLYGLPLTNQDSLTNVRDRDYFKAQLDPSLRGFYIGNSIQSRVDKRRGIPISYPLYHKTSGISLASAFVGINEFEEIYEQGRTKPHGSIALVHRSGTVLARVPEGEKMIGKSIATGQLWKEYLWKSERGAVILPATVIDQTARLTAYSSMHDFPLVVIVSSSMDDVLAAWWWWLYGGLLGGSMVSALIIVATHRMVSLLAVVADTRTEAQDQALRDALTGLPNRRMFHRRLAEEIGKADRDGLALAIMFIDLDRFKEINDSLGHSMGDILLNKAAQRLCSCVGSTDLIARLGGDEFTVILCGLTEICRAERIAQEILTKLAEPFQLNDEAAYVTASIGITLYPQHAAEIESLITNADQAMYAAKNEGRNRWKYFVPSMEMAAQNRMRLLNDVRSALSDKQLQVYYQPIVDLKNGGVRKAEALLRWQHPTRGFINPTEFIPIIEETEVIVFVGDWVFGEAVRQVKQWRASIDPDFQISINKSPAQFKHDGNSLEKWVSLLRTSSLPGSSIAIEITEGLLLDASETVTGKLLQLSDNGIPVSLDDFGTGYSSLSYLKKFSIDVIKIDRSFVSNLEDDSDSMALCEAIIVMAHKLGLKVIAEGIETVAQRDLLTRMGCDYGQGFFFSKPVAAHEFEELLSTLIC